MTYINLKNQARIPPKIIRNLHHDSHLFINDDPFLHFIDYFDRFSAIKICASTGLTHVTPIQVFWGIYKKTKGSKSERLVFDRLNYRHVRTDLIGNGVLNSPDIILPLSGLLIDKLSDKLLTKSQYFVLICSGSRSTERKVMVKQKDLVHIGEFSGRGCTFMDIRTGLVENSSKIKKYVSYLK